MGAFDAPFFSLTAKEAAAMDPIQRWTLETSYHAFEKGEDHDVHPLEFGLVLY